MYLQQISILGQHNLGTRRYFEKLEKSTPILAKNYTLCYLVHHSYSPAFYSNTQFSAPCAILACVPVNSTRLDRFQPTQLFMASQHRSNCILCSLTLTHTHSYLSATVRQVPNTNRGIFCTRARPGSRVVLFFKQSFHNTFIAFENIQVNTEHSFDSSLGEFYFYGSNVTYCWRVNYSFRNVRTV